LFRDGILISLAAILVAGCAEAGDNQMVSSRQADFHVVTVVQELNHPWSLTFLPGGDYLVSERRGKLWRISSGGRKIEITGVPEVYHHGQGGLLDIALEPGFEDGGWLYFSYAAAASAHEDIANTQTARAKLNLQKNRLTDIEVIFRAVPKVAGDNHWGSRLLFASDGNLFITLGERFDYKEEAQNLENHLGAVVRVAPDGNVPPDNPFVGQGDKRPEIYSYGHRNAQGISLHPETGKIWIHEHGPKGGDEINRIRKGKNYGWPLITYGVNYDGSPITNQTKAENMEQPLYYWLPSIAPCGMAFVNSKLYPEWNGSLLVGSLKFQYLERLFLKDGRVIGREKLFEKIGRLRNVKQAPKGEIYFAVEGKGIYKILPFQD